MNPDQDAPFRIEYSRESDLLCAHLTGVNGSFETTVAYWTELAGELLREPAAALLVVDDMAGDIPTPDELARFVAVMRGLAPDNVRVAFVEAHAQQIAELEFGEILAREYGFHVRVFGNEADARIWLRHGIS